MRRLAVVPMILVLSACGSGSSPTSPTPPPTPAPTPATSPAPGAPTVLRSATFQSANGYLTAGDAAILRSGGDHMLRLEENFRTSNSSALEVRLCRETKCTERDLNLGRIQKFSGAQTYAMPDDGSAYTYVVIWCRGVSLPFGFGKLR